MCTVSFVPSSNGIIITSNRDEQIVRKPASLPQHFSAGKYTLHYPVDGKANGTWFVCRNDGSIGVLLNGAFEKHEPQPWYKASRGSIIPHIFKQENPLEALQKMDLCGIENCTLILYHKQCLHECGWNGTTLNIIQLNEQQPHIYSSVTLYNKDMIQQRENWFRAWLQEHTNPTQNEVIAFHANTNTHNKEFGLQINRANTLQTISITSVCIYPTTATLVYHDFLQQQHIESTISLNIQQPSLAC
jgi:hypothetical protein